MGSASLPQIIQRYIDRPLLIDKRKFDIRCYLLIASTLPKYHGACCLPFPFFPLPPPFLCCCLPLLPLTQQLRLDLLFSPPLCEWCSSLAHPMLQCPFLLGTFVWPLRSTARKIWGIEPPI